MPNHSLFPDQYADIAQREAMRRPGPHDAMVATILNMVRRANITVSQPAHLAPTVWSTPVDLSARINVPAAVGAYTTAVTFTCPPGRWARINLYGVNVLDPLYTYDGSLEWRFTVAGLPLGDGMSNWSEQRGSLISPRETFIILKEEQVLTFQVRRAVAALAAQDVDMSIQGWIWPLRNTYEGTAASVTAF